MSLSTIPLAATPAQVLRVQLGDQSVALTIRQRRTGLFVDVSIGDAPVVQGVLALDRTYIVRDAYRGFAGDLAFVDTQGLDDPSYDGLGSRWLLLWDSEAA